MTDDGSQDCYSNMTFKSHLSLEFGMASYLDKDWLFTIWALYSDSYVWICSISPWNITFSFPFPLSLLGESELLRLIWCSGMKNAIGIKTQHFEPELYRLATEYARQSFSPPLHLYSITEKMRSTIILALCAPWTYEDKDELRWCKHTV